MRCFSRTPEHVHHRPRGQARDLPRISAALRGLVEDEAPQHPKQQVRIIRANGYEGRFYQKKITYYEEAGLVYWTMGAPLEETVIINRCRKDDTFESRSKNGTLPRDRFVRPSDRPDLVETPRGGGEG